MNELRVFVDQDGYYGCPVCCCPVVGMTASAPDGRRRWELHPCGHLVQDVCLGRFR